LRELTVGLPPMLVGSGRPIQSGCGCLEPAMILLATCAGCSGKPSGWQQRSVRAVVMHWRHCATSIVNGIVITHRVYHLALLPRLTTEPFSWSLGSQTTVTGQLTMFLRSVACWST